MGHLDSQGWRTLEWSQRGVWGQRRTCPRGTLYHTWTKRTVEWWHLKERRIYIKCTDQSGDSHWLYKQSPLISYSWRRSWTPPLGCFGSAPLDRCWAWGRRWGRRSSFPAVRGWCFRTTPAGARWLSWFPLSGALPPRLRCGTSPSHLWEREKTRTRLGGRGSALVSASWGKKRQKRRKVTVQVDPALLRERQRFSVPKHFQAVLIAGQTHLDNIEIGLFHSHRRQFCCIDCS